MSSFFDAVARGDLVPSGDVDSSGLMIGGGGREGDEGTAVGLASLTLTGSGVARGLLGEALAVLGEGGGAVILFVVVVVVVEFVVARVAA